MRLKNAQVVHQDRVRLFSILRKTHLAMDETPAPDKNYPIELQELNLRHTR